MSRSTFHSFQHSPKIAQFTFPEPARMLRSPRCDRIKSVRFEAVQALATLAAHRHNAGFIQDSQLLRDRRKRKLEVSHELSG